MGRSDGREGGGAATAMTAQRRLRRRSDGNGDGGAVMGVAVVAVAVVVVHRPPLFACGCSSAAPDPSSLALLSLSLTSGMYFPILHIFNVGILYTQTDGQTDRRQFNHFYNRNLLNLLNHFDEGNGTNMRKAAHPLGGVGSSNTCRWRGEQFHHHGDGIC